MFMRAVLACVSTLFLLGAVACDKDPSPFPDNCGDATQLPHEHYLCHFETCLEMLSTDDYEALTLFYDADALEDSRTGVTAIQAAEWVPPVPVQVDMGYPTYDVTFPIDWNVDPYEDRTWQHRFHSLYWLEDYYSAAEDGDVDSLKTAFLIISDWIKANAFWPGTHTRFQWGDHSSTIRMRILAQGLQLYLASSLADPLFQKRLQASIAAHIYFLASDAFYMEQSNHGIMSDMGLLLQPMNVEGFSDTEEIFAWANSRIELQFTYAFTADGVHKEHSPCYHLFVSRMLRDYRNIVAQYTDWDHAHWDDLLDNTARFATHITQPTGFLPGIGDCHDGGEVVASTEYLNDNPELLYAITEGAQGARPADTMAVFDVAGWAVFRSSWDLPFSGITYAAIQSDFHSNMHYHEDDTSFIITSHGVPLLVDPGYHSYNYNPIDLYARAASAHNVLIVDDRDFEKDLARVGTAGITRWLEGSVGSWRGIVELVHSHYEDMGVQLSRLFAQLDDTSFGVKDIVTADGEHDYTQLFHLAPGSVFTDVGAGVYRFQWVEHETSVWLRNTSASFDVVEGQQDPVQGWVCPELLVSVPAQVLRLTLSAAQDAEMTTLISRSPMARPRSRTGPFWALASFRPPASFRACPPERSHHPDPCEPTRSLFPEEATS
jgi:hypothetical protein